MADKDYQVLSPIKHGGMRFEIGATVTMDEKTAEPFIGSVLDEAAPKVVVHAAPADEAERRAAIKEAIGKLDANDASQWMKNGAPKTDAIQVHTLWPVAGKDRDAVWAEIKAAAKAD